MPTLVTRLVPADRPGEDRPWVLQRLGGAPMAADATVASLEWLDGEELHLAPADDPLPELDFDDVADGIATAVNRHRDRWDDRIKRVVFIGLAAALVFWSSVLLLLDGSRVLPAITLGIFGLSLAATAVMRSRQAPDRALPAVCAVIACPVLGLAAGAAVTGGSGVLDGDAVAILSSGIGMALAAAMLLSARALSAPRLPVAPLGLLAAVGAVAAISSGYLAAPEPAHGPAAIGATLAIVLLVIAPRIATRSARLRGPQLPRASDELGVDIEPATAQEITARTARADEYLTIMAVTCSLVVLIASVSLLESPDWATHLVVALVCTLVLTRAREFLNSIQRTALALSGVVGMALLAGSLTATASTLLVVIVSVALSGAAVVLAISGHRPSHRRAIPIWAHLVNYLETCVALAMVPIVLQVLGVFAWARGLAG